MDGLPQKLTQQFGSRSTIWGTILHGYRSRWTRIPSGTRSRSASMMPRFATSWITSTQLLPSSMPHPSHLFRYTLVSSFRTYFLSPLVLCLDFSMKFEIELCGQQKELQLRNRSDFQNWNWSWILLLFSMNQTQVSIFLWNQNWN